MSAARLIHIDDLTDPRLDAYRELRTRNPTRYGRRFIVESEKLVGRMVASGLEVESILVDATVATVPVEWSHSCSQIYRISDASPLVGFHFHRGALACGIRPAERSAIDWLADAVETPHEVSAVYLHGVQDPENLGSIFRCCAAMGVRHAILGPQCADPLSRRVVRVSMGGVLKLQLLVDLRPLDFLHAARTGRVDTVAATLSSAAVPLPQLRTSGRWILLLGNEAYGLPQEVVEACSHGATIPMRFGVDSLNVAVAAGIFMYQLRVQDATDRERNA